MPVIIEKKESSEKKTRYVLVGAGRVPSNFGSSEEPFVAVCDKDGHIKILTDYADTLRVVNVNGKTPAELLKD